MYKETSSSQSSTPRKSQIIEMVEVHRTEKPATPNPPYREANPLRESTSKETAESIPENLHKSVYPVPLPRRKLFIGGGGDGDAGGGGTNTSNNNDGNGRKHHDGIYAVEERVSSLESFKKSKEEKNVITKLKEIPILTPSPSSSSSSAASTPQPSKRNEFFFAESRNDTVVTNDDDGISINSPRKIQATSHVEHINEKPNAKRDASKSRRRTLSASAATTTTSSPIDSESSQSENLKTIIVPRISSPKWESKLHRRKSKTRVPSQQLHHHHHPPSSSSDSSTEIDSESDGAAVSAAALSKKMPKRKRDRRKSHGEHFYRKHGEDGGRRGVSVVDGEGDKMRSSSGRTDYDYEKIVGIFLHRTSELRYDSRMHSPRLRISICDLETKHFLKKSAADRNVVHFGEPEIVDYIQPVISRGGMFVVSSSYICEWEELILLNEDIEHLKNDKIVIIFELVDIIPAHMKHFQTLISQNGWHHICWAFLKVFPENRFSNIDQKLKLQFYEYQKMTKAIVEPVPILEQLLSVKKRKKYPGTLDITIKGIQPILRAAQPVGMRSENALQEEKSEPFLDVDSNDILQDSANVFTDAKYLLTITNKWKKLPGQSFKAPKKMLKKIIEHKSGTMTAKFDKTGDLLAYTTSTPHDGNVIVNILKIPSCDNILSLRGHSKHIYDIDWRDFQPTEGAQNLVTASSDRTAIFWIISRLSYSFKILPHPTFVYTAKFFYPKNSKNEIFIITGGRDSFVRVWRLSYGGRKGDDYVDDGGGIFDLSCELKCHKGYITGMVTHPNGENVYTCDSQGNVVEWLMKMKHSKMNGTVLRQTNIATGGHISSMLLHPRGRKLIINFMNSQEHTSGIKILDIDSLHIIKSFPETSTEFSRKFTISPCGTLLFTSMDDGSIEILNLISKVDGESHINSAFRFNSKNFVSSLDFHPKDSYLSCCVYGPNGGLSIYEHEMHISKYSRPKWNLPSVSELKLEPKKNLREIIQRIDDVFLGSTHGPARSVKHYASKQLQTDELIMENVFCEKELPSLSPPTSLTPKEASHMEIKEQVESRPISSESSDDNRTYSVHREDTYNAADLRDRTFSIERKNSVVERVLNDNTYEIKNEDEEDGDATSISECLD